MPALAAEGESEYLSNLDRLCDDLPFFAAECLKIRDKSGAIVPFVLNAAQCYLHAQLEEQRRETGKVRALLLKARQQGFSTYIGARFFHRTSLGRGIRTFILTHEQEATDTLFEMVERFHAHTPLRPHTGAANAKELFFDVLDSGYSVGTAGTKAVGRSKTIQLLHGSECAFWPNAASHFAGVVQAVPDLAGTEIVLESTANGPAGEFYERWQQAEAGVGDYRAIFVPWFWSLEYSRPVPPGFVLDAEEEECAVQYSLDMGQMAWRRAKMAELKDPILFKQEYPASSNEAFQTTSHDSYIGAGLILAARKASCAGIGPLVIGVDPARFGDDAFAIAWRRGRQVSKVEMRNKIDLVTGSNWLRTVIDQDKPAKVFVDVGGLGAGVVDILRSWGAPYDDLVSPVNFGAPPVHPIQMMSDGKPVPGARNRRAEIWMASKDWLSDPGGADIPDLDSLQADATGPSYVYDMQQRLQLESKEHMRARGRRSPDGWDAVALTFAEPVNAPTRAKSRIHVIDAADPMVGY